MWTEIKVRCGYKNKENNDINISLHLHKTSLDEWGGGGGVGKANLFKHQHIYLSIDDLLLYRHRMSVGKVIFGT